MGYIGKVKDTAGNTHLVGSTLYGTCNTGASTAAKVVTCNNFTELVEGVTIHVKFTQSLEPLSSTMTLNVNGTGAVAIKGYHPHCIINTIVSFTYDGTSWVMNDVLNTMQDQIVIDGLTNLVEEENLANGSYLPKVTKTTVGGSTAIGVGFTGIDTSVPSGSTSTNVPTTAAVAAAIDQATGGAAGALVYKGTAAALTDITGTSYEKGWYWIASAAFSWTGPNSTTVTVEPGDMIIAHQAKTSTVGNDLDAIQTNIETLTTTEVSNLWTAAVAVS